MFFNIKVATVELQINDDANPALLTAFVITTALLVGTSMMAVMISTCILPHIQAVAKMSNVSLVGQSPHERMTFLVDLSWVLANTASLFFFTLGRSHAIFIILLVSVTVRINEKIEI